MTTAEELLTITEKDEQTSAVLGAEYDPAGRWAADITKEFEAVHMKPLIEKHMREFYDSLWSTMDTYIVGDAELNIAGTVRNLVRQTVDALLNGKEWAMKQYPYADYSRGEEIRKAVCYHGGNHLLVKRIEDLEAELAKAEEAIKILRR